MRSVARVLAAAGVAAATITCADSPSAPRRSGLAWLPISPAFVVAPAGGPRIGIARVRGILKKPGAADSAVAEANVRGDSAILDFPRVLVAGDSTTYDLAVMAFDASEVVVFKGHQQISVKPGDNNPAAPLLEYIAPDAGAVEIETRAAGAPVGTASLQWAGAQASDFTCLNRAPSPGAATQIQLSAVGRDDAGTIIPDVRVGWTSRDTSVATVDASGLVRARCSNRGTWIVARTYLNVADSVRVDVSAPPFTLLMEPGTAELPRLDSLQLAAVAVDENGNAIAATGVTWGTSDSSRATVSPTGMVHGIADGRVVITASSDGRTTVGIIQVRPPRAASVQVVPAIDTLAIGQSRLYRAVAFDASGAQIPDAAGFTWGSMHPGIAQVSPGGVLTGMSAGDALVYVKIDGMKDTAFVHVREATDGAVTGRLIVAGTGGIVVGATVTASGQSTTTDGNGVFTLAGLVPGADLQISASAVHPATFYNVPVALGQTVDLRDIPLSPVGAAGAGTVSGTVLNALDDSPVIGATVKIFPGINAPSADPRTGESAPAVQAETVTDGQGNFVLAGVPSRTYTYAVGTTGYSLTRGVVVSVGGVTNTLRIALAPVVAGASDIRVVLNWGDCAGGTSNSVPCDLDSHVTGPAGAPDNGRFHVAHFNEVHLSGLDTVATLDNDATGGLGPETITLRPRSAGAFKYYVHNYTDGADTSSARLSLSQARVEVYRGAHLIATFRPPSESGVLWAVFQYDGTKLTPVNEMIRAEDFPTVPGDFLRAPSEGDEIRTIVAQRKK